MKIIYYIIILLILSVNVSFATNQVVMKPFKETILRSGDIVWVLVQGENEVEWEKLKNSNLNEMFYLLNFKKEEAGTLLEVVVRDLDKSETAKKEKSNLNIILDGLTYSQDGTKAGQELVNIDLDIEYSSFSLKIWQKTLVVLGFCSLLSGFIFYVLKRQKLKKEYLAKQKILFEKMQFAKTRHEFETIFSFKNQLDIFFEFEQADFTRFVSKMNEIQFKRDWNDVDLQAAKVHLDKIIQNIRKKRWNSKI